MTNNNRMIISVLMCTYNGEQYIQEQLESLYNQDRKPDEVVIVDDCSTDNTLNLITEFMRKHDLHKTWSLYCNTSNIGYITNFRNGLSLLHGDIVMFCDQDDIWFPNKIKQTIAVFEENPQIEVVGTDLIHFYPNKKEVFEGKFDKSREMVFYGAHKRNFIFHPAGCTMAVRYSYIKKIVKYYSNTWSHDDFFWRYAVVDGACLWIHDSFMKHRISGTNVTSRHFYSIEDRKKQAYRNKTNYEQLYDYCTKKKNYSEKISECIKYFWKGNEIRYKFLENPKIQYFIMIIKYHSIYLSLKQFLGDVIIGYQNRFTKKV